MCSFKITNLKTMAVTSCKTAWDVFNTIVKITSDFFEANSKWKEAGHLNIGESLEEPKYTIERLT